MNYQLLASDPQSTQAERILRAIRQKPGITNFELARIALKYNARISELRQDGWDIRSKRVWRNGRATGTFGYYLEPSNEYGDES